MLSMAAFKVGNPIQGVVSMKTHNFTWGPGRFCLHGVHVSQLAFYSLLPANLRTGPTYTVSGQRKRGPVLAPWAGI